MKRNRRGQKTLTQRRKDAKKSRQHSVLCASAPLRDKNTELKGVTDRIVAMIGELSQ